MIPMEKPNLDSVLLRIADNIKDDCANPHEVMKLVIQFNKDWELFSANAKLGALNEGFYYGQTKTRDPEYGC